MTMKELTQKLEERYPLEKAESWDNSGLQVGRKNKAVRKVFLALDATDAVIKEAAEWKADMLLTHHPLTQQFPFSLISKDSVSHSAILLS